MFLTGEKKNCKFYMEALRPGALDCARYQHVAKFLKEQGLIKKNPRLESHAIEVPAPWVCI